MVRILEFGDGKRLVARLRMPPLHDNGVSDDIVATRINCEMNAMFLVRQKTDVPIPQIYAFETTSHNAVKAPFMLMDCLDGNVGMDLGMQVPVKHQKSFFKSLAKIHVSNNPWMSER
jgi:aminoglycoside phosphotransferase (APT) family kinase protein